MAVHCNNHMLYFNLEFYLLFNNYIHYLLLNINYSKNEIFDVYLLLEPDLYIPNIAQLKPLHGVLHVDGFIPEVYNLTVSLHTLTL